MMQSVITLEVRETRVYKLDITEDYCRNLEKKFRDMFVEFEDETNAIPEFSIEYVCRCADNCYDNDENFMIKMKGAYGFFWDYICDWIYSAVYEDTYAQGYDAETEFLDEIHEVI